MAFHKTLGYWLLDGKVHAARRITLGEEPVLPISPYEGQEGHDVE